MSTESSQDEADSGHDPVANGPAGKSEAGSQDLLTTSGRGYHNLETFQRKKLKQKVQHTVHGQCIQHWQ
jgi:hypothetical protein